jgi:hypothetical protein
MDFGKNKRMVNFKITRNYQKIFAKNWKISSIKKI